MLTTSTKEMASENKRSNNMQNKNTITKGVVITVYVESPRTRSIKPSKDPTNKINPHPHFRMPQTTGTQGYDRRAQLLAYSRQLRENAMSQKNVQVQLPQNQSQPTSKAEPVRICLPSTQMPPSSRIRFGQECAEYKGSKEIKQFKMRKGNGKCCKVLRKLKNMLKKLSCKEI